MKKIILIGVIFLLFLTSALAVEYDCTSGCDGNFYPITEDTTIKLSDTTSLLLQAPWSYGEITFSKLHRTLTPFSSKPTTNYYLTDGTPVTLTADVFENYEIKPSSVSNVEVYLIMDKSHLDMKGYIEDEIKYFSLAHTSVKDVWIPYPPGRLDDIFIGIPLNLNNIIGKYSLGSFPPNPYINILNNTLNMQPSISCNNTNINNNFNNPLNNYQINNTILVSNNPLNNITTILYNDPITNNQYTISINPLNNITTIIYNNPTTNNQYNVTFDNANNNYNNNTNVNNIFVNSSGVYDLDNQVFFNQTSITYNNFDNPITIPLSIFENVTRNDNITYILEIKDGAFSITPQFTNNINNQYNNQFNTNTTVINPDFVASCNEILKDKNILFYVIIGVLTLIIIILLIFKNNGKKEPIYDYPEPEEYTKPRKKAVDYEETEGIPTIEKPFQVEDELENVSIDELKRMRKRNKDLRLKNSQK